MCIDASTTKQEEIFNQDSLQSYFILRFNTAMKIIVLNVKKKDILVFNLNRSRILYRFFFKIIST